MTSHTPEKVPEPPLMAPVLGVLAMATVLAAVIWAVVTLTSRAPFDDETFCDGHAEGVVFGLVLGGVSDEATVRGWVEQGNGPGCRAITATRSLEGVESWCEGFAQGFFRAGELMGEEAPAEGPVRWVELAGAECAAAGEDEESAPGGGGPPPQNR